MPPPWDAATLDPPSAINRGGRTATVGALLFTAVLAAVWFYWPGTLVVTAAPEGTLIRLDGETLGTAPTTLRLQPGRYAVELLADGHEPLQRAVRIRRATEASITADLAPVAATPTEAMVVFQSLPPGAMVTLEDASPFLAGNAKRVPLQTPLRIRMELEGYAPWEERRTLQPGESVLTIALQPLPSAAERAPGEAAAGDRAPQAPVPTTNAPPAPNRNGAVAPSPPTPQAAPRFALADGPPNARFWINDREVTAGTTLTWPGDQRSVRLRGEAPGHQPTSLVLERSALRSSTPVALSWQPLSSGEGTLEVRFVREPMVGTVYVDGERVGRSERLTETWRVPAGTRRVEVVHEGRGLRASRTLDVPTDGHVVFSVQWVAQSGP